MILRRKLVFLFIFSFVASHVIQVTTLNCMNQTQIKVKDSTSKTTDILPKNLNIRNMPFKAYNKMMILGLISAIYCTKEYPVARPLFIPAIILMLGSWYLVYKLEKLDSSDIKTDVSNKVEYDSLD